MNSKPPIIFRQSLVALLLVTLAPAAGASGPVQGAGELPSGHGDLQQLVASSVTFDFDPGNLAVPLFGALQDESGDAPASEAPVGEAAQSASDLAKATQNPVADLISLPFQNNMNFGVGPGNDTQNVLNIQPVIPFDLTEDWMLITRSILPVIYQPEIISGTGDEFGLGDFQFTGWLSPVGDAPLVWGVGPVLRIPTATDSKLGTEKWSAGPSVVVVAMPSPWVVGGVLQNVWSFAGDDDRTSVNELLFQPFVNYNLEDGWYLSSSPIITANWEADSGDRWTVPLGGGFGKVFRIGDQPVNLSAQAFGYVEKPDLGPDWTLRLQLQLLFPR